MIFPKLSYMIIPSFNPCLIGKSMDKRRKINYESWLGRKVNKWTIVSYSYIKNRIHFLCECECGRTSTVQANAVFLNQTKCCKVCAAKKHGYFGTATYRCWVSAKNRCNNPNNKDYEHYGGRGIKMSPHWDKFENFLADMKEKPTGLTLDRIDNNGNYEPGNCRWATYSQQNSNQRKRFSSKILQEGNKK